MFPRYPGWCWDDRQSPLGPGRPVSRPPKGSVRPSGRARGGPRVGPQAGPKSPKMGRGTPSAWAKRTATSGFCPPGAHSAAFRGLSKLVKNGSKMGFSKNDTGPFGVSLEVFSARSGASVGRFDLRRVVWFTYPQCALQTMHALQKEVNGVKWCCTKRRETPFSSVLILSLD